MESTQIQQAGVKAITHNAGQSELDIFITWVGTATAQASLKPASCGFLYKEMSNNLYPLYLLHLRIRYVDIFFSLRTKGKSFIAS